MGKMPTLQLARRQRYGTQPRAAVPHKFRTPLVMSLSASCKGVSWHIHQAERCMLEADDFTSS